jgi:hypothetical protein
MQFFSFSCPKQTYKTHMKVINNSKTICMCLKIMDEFVCLLLLTCHLHCIEQNYISKMFLLPLHCQGTHNKCMRKSCEIKIKKSLIYAWQGKFKNY